VNFLLPRRDIERPIVRTYRHFLLLVPLLLLDRNAKKRSQVHLISGSELHELQLNLQVLPLAEYYMVHVAEGHVRVQHVVEVAANLEHVAADAVLVEGAAGHGLVLLEGGVEEPAGGGAEGGGDGDAGDRVRDVRW